MDTLDEIASMSAKLTDDETQYFAVRATAREEMEKKMRGPSTKDLFEEFRDGKITGTRCELVILLFCGLDYALGRMTYVTDVIPMLILRNRKLLRDGDLYTMIERIDDAEKHDNLGSPTIDAPGWRRFRDNLKAELADREKKRGKKC